MGQDIAALGMPRRAGAALEGLARTVAADPAIFTPRADLAGAIAALKALPGVGEWTAQYIALRELRELDAFPQADIGLMRAMADEAGVRPHGRAAAGPQRRLDARGAPTPRNTSGPPTRRCSNRPRPCPRGPRPMPAKLPETLTLDRTPTPIGTALAVTDEAGVLRAFNWTDYEPAMLKWIARRYPKARLVEGAGAAAGPPSTAYFAGEADAFDDVAWEAPGTAFQEEDLGDALHPPRR